MAGTGLTGSGYPYDEVAAREAGGPSFEQGYQLMASFLKSGMATGAASQAESAWLAIRIR